MKIAIIGPGAMGCLLAAYLSKTKEEIWVLDKDKDKAEKINHQGIIVEGASGNWLAKVKASASAQEIGQADLVLVCVKSYNTKEAILKAKPIVGEKSLVLSLQNGFGNLEIIQEVVGPDKVVGGTTSEGATLLGVGKVRHAGKGETIVGCLDGKISVELKMIREVFNKAGFVTRISKDIKGLLWSKLIINVGINALTAVTRLPNGRLAEFEGTKRIMRQAVTEATRIARRKKAKLAFDDPIAKVEAVCEATAVNLSSMLQDVLRNKRTEIDFINGVIVRLGQELGVPVPANAFLVDLVKTIESSYDLQAVKISPEK